MLSEVIFNFKITYVGMTYLMKSKTMAVAELLQLADFQYGRLKSLTVKFGTDADFMKMRLHF